MFILPEHPSDCQLSVSYLMPCMGMEKKSKSNDLKEVLRQEQGRGRRYAPSDEEKEVYRKRKTQLKVFRGAMKGEYVFFALPRQRRTQEYDQYYQIWRDYHRDCDEAY